MTPVPGHQAARTPSASVALTPSTTHGGHPLSRGAPVEMTMASSVRCGTRVLMKAEGVTHRRPWLRPRAQRAPAQAGSFCGPEVVILPTLIGRKKSLRYPGLTLIK